MDTQTPKLLLLAQTQQQTINRLKQELQERDATIAEMKRREATFIRRMETQGLRVVADNGLLSVRRKRE